MLVTSVALGVHALLADGGPAAITCLAGGAAALPALAEELHKALRAIVAQSGERLATHKLSHGSVFDLVHAQMAASALAAAAAGT